MFDKQKVAGPIPSEDTNPLGLASGRQSKVKLNPLW